MTAWGISNVLDYKENEDKKRGCCFNCNIIFDNC